MTRLAKGRNIDSTGGMAHPWTTIAKCDLVALQVQPRLARSATKYDQMA